MIFRSFSLSIPFLLLPSLALCAESTRDPWLDEVAPLLTSRECELFAGLVTDADRQAFVQGFWQARDPYPQTSRNEARERWEERLQEARGRWHDSRDERARFFLLNGEPETSFGMRCAGADVEVWTYEPRFQVKHRTILFFRNGDGPARLWRPGDAPDLLSANLDCGADERWPETSVWLRLTGKSGYESLVQRALTAPKPREWVSSFRPASAETRRSRSVPLPARLDVDFPGRREDGWIRVLVETGALSDEIPSHGLQREVILTGRILRGEETVDSFRYRFDSLPRTAGLPLAFERRLDPGQYKLEVELDAPASGRTFVAERELDVPVASPPAPAVSAVTLPVAPAAPEPKAAPVISPEVRRIFEEVDADLSAPRHGLRLLVPPGSVLAGPQRFEARVDGADGLPEPERVDRVTFLLDGKPVLTRNRPPFVAQLDLGRTPRPHRLAIHGINAGGEVLARDEVTLNAGAQRLTVRLVEPRPDHRYLRSMRIRAEVEEPEDRAVERVELFLGESRVATLYQSPYVLPLALSAGGTGYVRAVAYLADGTSAEDLVLLNSPVQPEKMDIRLVELYTNVVDGSGKPVEGLGKEEFRVFEDGAKQPIRLVERVTDTPLRLVTLIDNSASMQPRLGAARQAASQFLHRTLREKDQAAVVTFNRVPKVVASLTGDLGILEEGLSGLVAEEETSLYDSLIFSLYYLGGTSGQRAVLLLSDGLDRTSRFRYEDALECARRSGIAVYVIGIGLPRGEASQRLSRLASETGGRSFLLKDTGDLGKAYEAIETELRSRYRISYQSSNTRPGEAFRTVRVEVGKQGLEARTISGYYP